jgi:hypothetical protein
MIYEGVNVKQKLSGLSNFSKSQLAFSARKMVKQNTYVIFLIHGLNYTSSHLVSAEVVKVKKTNEVPSNL